MYSTPQLDDLYGLTSRIRVAVQRLNKHSVPLLLLLLLITSFGGSPAWAQTGYNRWDAKPVTTPKPATSAAQRGAQLARAKARQDSIVRAQHLYQDSLRIAAATAPTLLKRGIGQRIKDKRLQPEDATYFEYIRRFIKYPVEALRAQIGGDVVMKLSIDATGRVTHLKLVESTIPPGAAGEVAMIQQARLLLRQLRFELAAGVTEEEMRIGYRFE
ncbi:energy transducer TonB [Hymenobacter sp. DG01]|uniref:energy transducer TonB n=1 Tax=Hymenobacter sp. DG01 TaxID=2584940 RepID=UPI00111CAD76|nr:energy transducer TonB [Hymenobacter sp. DG01]